MTMATKQEVLKDKLTAYLAANKAGKKEILDQLEATIHMHRQAIIRRLNVLAVRHVGWQKKHSGRKEIYGPRVTEALKEIWELADHICAERLHPQLNELVSVLKRCKEWSYPSETTTLLLAASLGTVKDRIGSFPKVSRGSTGATKPSELKELVPIRRGPWDNPNPGNGEVDTVAHCGTSLIGDYAFTVQYTDVATIWTLLQAQWNKGMLATKDSLKQMRGRCPLTITGFDFDSGGEFINYQVVPWCNSLTPPISCTRTRPYRKNDHARIEQKNYTNVRHWVGYLRYDNYEQLEILNQLYLVLEDYLNFFLPSMKCVKKERLGSKYKRVYDTPQTAYARILAHLNISDEVKFRLKKKYDTLNPKQLKKQLTQLQQRLLTSYRKHRLQ
jgi:hypothetical protein